MASPIKLHPRIKERRVPRISASALAEYVIATPDKHDDIIHDAKFARPPATTPYSDALRVLRAYNTDYLRETGQVDAAIAALVAKNQSLEFKPSVRDEAARSAEAIELFVRNENAFGSKAIPMIECPRFQTFELGGITISCQPDFIVGSRFPPEDGKIGCAFIRLQKRPDPAQCKTDRTRDERAVYRREMASYLLTVARLALLENGAQVEQIDNKKLYVFDVRLAERVEMPTDRVSREKRLVAACKQIARLWDTTEPRPSDFMKDD